MNNAKRISLFFVLFYLFATAFQAQQHSFESIYGPVNEHLLFETKWRYQYTLHVESNTVIHQAENYYDFYLYYRYDYTYQQYLNGKLDAGTWSLSERNLFFPFKNILKFQIVNITKKVLVLEFNQPNAKGTYQYHFIISNDQQSPFVKPSNELPTILVEKENPKKNNFHKWWLNKKNKRNKKHKKNNKTASVENLAYINLELIGGGFYGGPNPVLRDYTFIKSNGRLIKELKNVRDGLQVTKANIPRQELEDFVDWVTRQGFFNFERLYDCTTPLCQKRKRQKPSPIPLRLAITYGLQKKVISVSIWGRDKNNIQYVDYPKQLDNIVDAIHRMATRSELEEYTSNK